MSYEEEFDRQLETLVSKGYPKLSGMETEEFVKMVSGLQEHLEEGEWGDIDMEAGHLPFVMVVRSELVPASEMMELIEREGKSGMVKLKPHVPEDFGVIESVDLPESSVYLLVDVDRGRESLNETTEKALVEIMKQGRTGLTIDEGIAVVTHYPEFLSKNNCFSLVSSRVAGNQRVPAIWINGQKHPNLGWCWDRNPHTWLGSASGVGRVALG